MWNSIVSVPDHGILIYFVMEKIKLVFIAVSLQIFWQHSFRNVYGVVIVVQTPIMNRKIHQWFKLDINKNRFFQQWVIIR